MIIKQIENEMEAIQWTGHNENEMYDFLDDIVIREITENVEPPTLELYVYMNGEYKLVNILDYVVYDSKIDKIYIYSPEDFNNKFKIIDL